MKTEKMKTIKPSHEEHDIHKAIRESTDIKHLSLVVEYCDMDLQQIDKDSDETKRIKAEMRGVSIKKMIENEKKGFLELKAKILKRIAELKGAQ